MFDLSTEQLVVMIVFDLSMEQFVLTLSKIRKGMLSVPSHKQIPVFAHPVNEYTPVKCVGLLC